MGRGLLWVGIVLLCGYLAMDKKDRPGTAPAVSASASAVGNTAYVEADALNMRAEPDADSAVLVTLGKNAGVEVLDRSGVWWKVKAGDVEGFVNSNYLGEAAGRTVNNITTVLNNLQNRNQGPDYDENGVRLTEYPGDPNAGTTRSRRYQERDDFYREKSIRENSGRIPDNVLEWARRQSSGAPDK